MESVLATEAAVFNAHLEEWRQDHMGKFVLIKGEEVVGFYDTLDDAFSEGSKRYGLADFFIKQIIPQETVNVSFVGRHLHPA